MKTLNRLAAIWLLAALLSIAAAVSSPAALARIIVARGGGDAVQDAVDRANPGDTIIVKAGIYKGGVNVNKDNITIKGSTDAVIDATGFEYGIMVGEDADINAYGCPPVTVQNFRIKGLTIKNAEDTGLLLIGVDGYRLTHGIYLDNEEYGPFPICSTNGVIAHNFAAGHKDAAIYVGDDDRVVVKYNVVIESAIGIEVENSVNANVHHNALTNNTIGILVVVLPGLPTPFTENVQITHNWIVRNNLSNPAEDPDDVVALIPTGSGVLNVGGDRVLIEKNFIVGNDSFGITILGNAFAALDPRIEPFVDENVIRKNVIRDNGHEPDPLRALTPGADIVFIPDAVDPVTGEIVFEDQDPADNCFAENRFDSDFPPGITTLFPCP